MRELLPRTRRLVGTLAVPAVGATILATAVAAGVWGAAPAGAAAPCVSTGFGGVRLIDWDGYNPKVEFSASVPVSLAPGSYDLSGASYDDYPARVGVTQLSEIWDVEFLAGDGSIIARSGTSGDLPDRVQRGEWAGPMGSVTLDRPAVAVRARHRPDAVGDGSANSVVPATATICGSGVGPATTVATSAPTTTAPEVTAAPTSAPLVPSTPPSTAPPSTTPATTAAPGAPTSSAAPDTRGPSPTTAPVQATTPTSPTKVAAETTVAPPSAGLASTGADIGGLQGTGLVLLGLGAVLLGVRTARRDEG